MKESSSDRLARARLLESSATRTGQHRCSVPAELANACQPIIIEKSQLSYATRLTSIRDRWLQAGAGREVIVANGHFRLPAERWRFTFVEDGKGLVSVSGRTWLEALELALQLLGLH